MADGREEMVTQKEIRDAEDVLVRLLDGTHEHLLGKYGREHLAMGVDVLRRALAELKERE